MLFWQKKLKDSMIMQLILCGTFLFVMLSSFGYAALNTSLMLSGEATIVPIDNEEFKFTIDTRMKDNVDTSADHLSLTTTSFAIPTSGFVGGRSDHRYRWKIDWGDGSQIEAVTGTSSAYSAGIVHDYASTGGPGIYQITLSSRGGATVGWMDAFGFYSTVVGANVQANKSTVKSIDTPLTDRMRTPNVSYRFAYMFYCCKNSEIPVGFFDNITISNDTTDVSSLLEATFYYNAYNCSGATIPAGIISNINIPSSATKVTNMFNRTFAGYGRNNVSGTIPSSSPFFGNLKVPSGATDLTGMFLSTFDTCFFTSTVCTIPKNMFITFSIPNNAKNLTSLFESTFNYYGYSSTKIEIPTGIFSTVIIPDEATNLSYMFQQTFRTILISDIPDDLFSGITIKNKVTTVKGMFYATFSTSGTSKFSVPGTLFSSITLPLSLTDSSEMFKDTFYKVAKNSTTFTIPDGLFRTVSTPAGASTTNLVNLSYMFHQTFCDAVTPTGSTASSSVATIPANLFGTIKTAPNSDMSHIFRSTFSGYNSGGSNLSATIPKGLFSGIDTSKAVNLVYAFAFTFTNYADTSTAATIPEGLFDTIDTSNAEHLTHLYGYTFNNFAGDRYNSGATATIPNNLFTKLDLTKAVFGTLTLELPNIFIRTFSNFAGYTDQTQTVDINNIWGNANFAGKVNADNASKMFQYTFMSVKILNGTAQTFIDNKLAPGLVPTTRSWTFAGTRVSDFGRLNSYWK